LYSPESTGSGLLDHLRFLHNCRELDVNYFCHRRIHDFGDEVGAILLFFSLHLSTWPHYSCGMEWVPSRQRHPVRDVIILAPGMALSTCEATRIRKWLVAHQKLAGYHQCSRRQDMVGSNDGCSIQSCSKQRPQRARNHLALGLAYDNMTHESHRRL